MRQNGEVLGLQGDSCSFGVCSEMFCNRKGHEGMLAGACSDQGRFSLAVCRGERLRLIPSLCRRVSDLTLMNYRSSSIA